MTVVGVMTRRLLRQGLVGTAMLLAGVLMFQFIYPFIADSLGGTEGLQSLVGQLPPAMQALAQLSPEILALTGIAGFISRAYDHPVYLILSISAMVGYTGRAIAGEVGSGTLALSLSRPISRRSIFAARLLGILVLAAAFGWAGPVATWLGLQVADPVGVIGVSQLAAIGWLGMLFLWTVGGLTLLVSAVSSSTGRVVGWATGYLVVAYFVDVFAELWTILEPIRPLSLFHYFDTTGTMVDGRVPLETIAVFGGVGLVAVLIGWLVFRQRDFMV